MQLPFKTDVSPLSSLWLQVQIILSLAYGHYANHVQGVALTLPQLSLEFGISESHVRFTTCALFVGLCIGASFWGIASDLVGRRLAFNMTLFLAGVFGTAVGGSPTWIGYVYIYYVTFPLNL